MGPRLVLGLAGALSLTCRFGSWCERMTLFTPVRLQKAFEERLGLG